MAMVILEGLILGVVKMWGAIAAAAISAYSSYQNSKSNRKQGSDALNTQIRLQREFAQKGIQWRVEDAKKAGIHPLAALGAQTNSPMVDIPQQTGDDKANALMAGIQAYQTQKQAEAIDADVALKHAQASLIKKEAQEMNSGPRPMWTQVYDNNPNSPTYKQLVWVPDPETNWAEQTESGAGFWGSIYSNLFQPKKKPDAIKNQSGAKTYPYRGKSRPRYQSPATKIHQYEDAAP